MVFLVKIVQKKSVAKNKKNANRKLLNYFFATITEANCFDEGFIKAFKNAIPSITRCDVVYEKILEKLKGGPGLWQS